MGLLDRIRAWLTGGSETGERDGPADDKEDTEAVSPSLGPDEVTEVRTESDDDPLEKLRELDADGADDAGAAGDDTADTEGDTDPDPGRAGDDAERP